MTCTYNVHPYTYIHTYVCTEEQHQREEEERLKQEEQDRQEREERARLKTIEEARFVEERGRLGYLVDELREAQEQWKREQLEKKQVKPAAKS